MARKLERSDGRERKPFDGDDPPATGSAAGRRLLDRRAYLKLGAAAVAAFPTSVVGRARTASATRHGMLFRKVLDAVDDLGMDPSGGTPVDQGLRAAGNGTLVRFPEGTYRLGTNAGNDALDGERRGIEGIGDDVALLAPPRQDEGVLAGERMDRAYIGNVSVAPATPDASGGVRLSGDRVVVNDVEFAGGPLGGRGLDGHSPGTDTLTIEGRGTATNYELTVDGRVEFENGSSAEYNRSGANSEGTVGAGTVSYAVDGEVADFRLDGPADVFVNGNPADPERLGRSSPHRLVFDADGETTAYEFSVERLYPGRGAASPEVSNIVREGVDVYRFAGDIESLTARGTTTLPFGEVT